MNKKNYLFWITNWCKVHAAIKLNGQTFNFHFAINWKNAKNEQVVSDLYCMQCSSTPSIYSDINPNSQSKAKCLDKREKRTSCPSFSFLCHIHSTQQSSSLTRCLSSCLVMSLLRLLLCGVMLNTICVYLLLKTTSKYTKWVQLSKLFINFNVN